jgi:hypothetical protein
MGEQKLRLKLQILAGFSDNMTEAEFSETRDQLFEHGLFNKSKRCLIGWEPITKINMEVKC